MVENSCLHKAIETLSLQDSCLSTLDSEDHSVLVPTKPFHTLPCELVERVLLLLDAKYISRCRLVDRRLNDIVERSTVLQYFLACKAAGVIDNPGSSLSYTERFDALKKREDAWRKLRPIFEMTIEIDHQPWSVNGLTAGYYFSVDNDRKYLHYCQLPSSLDDRLQWIKIPSHASGQSGSGTFTVMGMAIHEHDLLVNVVSSEVEDRAAVQRHSHDLVLLKLSTREYHPFAHHPRIHVQRSSSARLGSILGVVGDNLALVIYSRGGTFPDKLFIFDWKTGNKRLQHEATQYSYSSLVFISPELLLIPNLILSHFEVWYLPPSHTNNKPPVQILSLKIPAISQSYSILTFNCYGESNTFLHSIPYSNPRPFFPSQETSIIIANLRLSGFKSVSYTLIIYRSTLLDTIQKWTSLSVLEQEDIPTWLTNEVTVHKFADPDDGSVRVDVQSKAVSTVPHQRPSPPTLASTTNSTTLTSHISPETCSSYTPGSSASAYTHRYHFPQIQWADWGPPISRWFRSKDPQAQYITTLSGHRCAFLFPNPHDTSKSMISVVDFNPHNVRKNENRTVQEKEGKGNKDDNNGKRKAEEREELEMLVNEGVFLEEVYMGLKYVIYHAPDGYDFNVVLMDEERLLGLKIDRNYRPQSIKVLYFG